MVVVGKLTKEMYFIHVKTTHKEENIADIYMKEVARIHGVPKEVVLDRDSKFTSKFWQGLLKGFGTNLNLSMTYNPKSNGKIERTNRIIEYMLRMYVIYHPSKWEDYIHLVEFSYNNGYQASLKMSPFEALYDKKCNTSELG
jgi:transposase InsO family protein